jgi:hypothetical protein
MLVHMVGRDRERKFSPRPLSIGLNNPIIHLIPVVYCFFSWWSYFFWQNAVAFALTLLANIDGIEPFVQWLLFIPTLFLFLLLCSVVLSTTNGLFMCDPSIVDLWSGTRVQGAVVGSLCSSCTLFIFVSCSCQLGLLTMYVSDLLA